MECSHRVFIVAILGLLLLGSCKDTFSPSLREADKVLFTDAKRGEVMLDSIYQANPNMSTPDKKYYQLLKNKS